MPRSSRSGAQGRATASSSRSSGTQGRATASSSRSSGTQGSSRRGRIRISTRNRDEGQQTTQQSRSRSQRRRQPSTSSSSSSSSTSTTSISTSTTSSSDTTEEYELALSVTVSIPSGGHSTASPRTSRDPPPPSSSGNSHAQPPRDPAPSRPTVEHWYLPGMMNPSLSEILRPHHQRQRAGHGDAGNEGGRISFQIETDHHGPTEEPQTSRTLPSSSEPIVVDDDSPPRVSPPRRRPVMEEFGSNNRRIISMFRAQNRYNEAQNNGRDLIFHYDLGAIGVGGQRKPRVNMTTAQIKEAILLSPRNGDDNTFLRNNECNICLQSFRDLLLQQHHLVSTTCGHVFCRECATKSIKPSSSGTKCPCCRKKLEVPYYFRLHLPMHPKFKKSKHIKEEEEAEPSRL